MPSKLVIPIYSSQGKLIRIRFRIDNPSKGTRYRLCKGSDPSSPYPIGVMPRKPVIIVESELDAILFAQKSNDLVGVMGLGSTAVDLTPDAIKYLNGSIPLILICMDNDQSGQSKTFDLMKKLSNAVNWPIPKDYGKDPGESWKKMDLRKWVQLGLTDYLGGGK